MATRPYAYPSFGQAPNQATVAQPVMTKTIPFDYAFQFTLKGERGNKVQDVVEISMQGVFVAVSLGYSLVLDERTISRTFEPRSDQATVPQPPVAVPLFSGTSGHALGGVVVAGQPGSAVAVLNLTEALGVLPAIVANGNIGPDGTATLPFSLVPGSVIRTWDRSNNLLSQVIENGQLAEEVTPVVGFDPNTGRLPAAGEERVFVYGAPEAEVNLVLLNGATQAITQVNGVIRLLEQTISGLRTGRAEVRLPARLAPGDVLLARTAPGQIIDPFSMYTIPRPRLSSLTLSALVAGLEKSGTDLAQGFRLNRDFANLLVADPPLDQLAQGTLGRVFQTGCVAAEEASFLYSIDVAETGRELQNKAIHNIAGLGIANGDRPFRPFAKPVAFEPRSFIRIQVEELSGPPGTLFIVLQGYKVLGTGRIPG